MSDIHSQLAGLELHDSYHFAQATDPGAVGSNINWLDTSASPFIPKRRNSDNTGWIEIGNTTTSPLTTKGDLLGYSTAIGRVGIGSDGEILTADSGQSFGFKWAAPSSSSIPAWVTNHPDTPPVSGNATDDEFTSAATLPGGGSAKWTALNSSSYGISIVNGRLQLIANASATILTGIYQNVPTAPYTATIKLSMAGAFASAMQAGLFLYDGTKLRTWQIGQTPIFVHQTWNTTSSPTTNIFTTTNNGYLPPQVCYLRIINDSTNFNLAYSADGINYQILTSGGVTTTLTPTKIGIGAYNSSGVPLTMIIDFFRVTQP